MNRWLFCLALPFLVLPLVIPKESSARRRAFPPVARPEFKVGDVVGLRGKTGGVVCLFVDTVAWDLSQKYTEAGDNFGNRQLLLSGRVFSVTPQTSARVLAVDPMWERLEVRITSGPEAGRAGLVPMGVAHP